MRMLKGSDGSCYFFGKLPFNKGIEFGWRPLSDRHFDFNFRLNFQGHDHAGLRVFFQFLGTFVEFNLTDYRHWDDENDRWQDPNLAPARNKNTIPAMR